MSQSLTVTDFFKEIDTFFIRLLAGLFVVTLLLANWHNTWVEAFVIGLPAVAVPFLISRMMPGHMLSRFSIAAALMVFSGLMIHQGHGMIEMHFGIFALLAALLYYRDPLTILAAAAVIAVHHLSFNYMQEAGVGVYVFEYRSGLDIVILHAAFVVAESALLMYMAHKNWQEFRQSIELNNIGNHLHKNNGLDLTYRVNKPISEFGVTFNNFFEAINNVVSKASELSARIGTDGERMHQSNLTLQDGATKQNRGSDEISTSTQNLSSAIAGISEQSESASSTASETRDLAKQSNSDIRETRTDIEKLAGNIEKTNLTIQKLDEETANIGSVLSVIQGIAEQTNLLALNAAIEAARAGEQGRGFAVVADEVRSLAAKTHDSTEEIHQMIERLQAGSGEAVKAMDTSLNNVKNSVAQITRLDEHISEMKARIETVWNINQAIAAASNEQMTAINGVNTNLLEIRTISESTLQESHSTGEISSQLVSMSRSLDDLLSQFRT